MSGVTAARRRLACLLAPLFPARRAHCSSLALCFLLHSRLASLRSQLRIVLPIRSLLPTMRSSSVLVVLALMALVALVAAVPQHKLQSRGAKHAAAKHAAPHADVLLEAEESTEIVNSLKQLLEQKKVRREHDTQERRRRSSAIDIR